MTNPQPDKAQGRFTIDVCAECHQPIPRCLCDPEKWTGREGNVRTIEAVSLSVHERVVESRDKLQREYDRLEPTHPTGPRMGGDPSQPLSGNTAPGSEPPSADSGSVLTEAQTRIAELEACGCRHRICTNEAHDPAKGMVAGACVVCGLPWPCPTENKGDCVARLSEAQARIAELEAELETARGMTWPWGRDLEAAEKCVKGYEIQIHDQTVQAIDLRSDLAAAEKRVAELEGGPQPGGVEASKGALTQAQAEKFHDYRRRAEAAEQRAEQYRKALEEIAAPNAQGDNLHWEARHAQAALEGEGKE